MSKNIIEDARPAVYQPFFLHLLFLSLNWRVQVLIVFMGWVLLGNDNKQGRHMILVHSGSVEVGDKSVVLSTF